MICPKCKSWELKEIALFTSKKTECELCIFSDKIGEAIRKEFAKYINVPVKDLDRGSVVNTVIQTVNRITDYEP